MMITPWRTREGSVYPGAIKIEILKRLDETSALQLADYLNIPISDRRQFRQGEEARGVWEWLEHRGRLGDLFEALRHIGRDDLASVLPPGNPVDLSRGMGVAPVAIALASRGRRAWAPLAIVLLAVMVGGGIFLTCISWRDGNAPVNAEPPSFDRSGFGTAASGVAPTSSNVNRPAAAAAPAGTPALLDPDWPATADPYPCRYEDRPAGKEELSFLCPMLWDSPDVGLREVPVFAGYLTANLTPVNEIDQLIKGKQYFNCQIRGAQYAIGPQPGAAGARHIWWAFTEGDGNQWGFVPEVYLWGGPDFMPDPGLPACQASELTRRGR
jgi:hypothetical protein